MKLLKIFGLGMALGQRVPIRVPSNIDLEQLQSEAISSLQGSMAGKMKKIFEKTAENDFLILKIFDTKDHIIQYDWWLIFKMHNEKIVNIILKCFYRLMGLFRLFGFFRI